MGTVEAALVPLLYVLYFGWCVYLARQRMSPASRVNAKDGSRFSIEAGGRRVRFWNEVEDNGPTFLFAVIDFDSRGQFELVREGSTHRLARGLGLARDVDVGYSRFDDTCYLMTDHRDFALAMFRDARRRDAALRLFQAGACNILCAEGKVTAVFPLQGDDAASQSGADRFAQDLVELARVPPPAPSERDLASARNAGRRRIAAHLLPLPLFAAWILMRADRSGYPLVDSHEWSDLHWRFFWIGLAAVLVPAVLLLWRLPQAKRDLAVIGMLAFVCLSAESDEIAAWVNGRFDRSQPLEQVLDILADQERGHLQVRSWRPGRTVEEVRVPRTLYQEARPGIDRLGVVTRPGTLRAEWIAGVRLIPGEAPPLTGDLATAEAKFRQALALDPNSFEARRQLDGVLARQARWPEIVALWDAFLAEQPGHAGAHFERAGTHRHAGNMPAAMQDLARACELGEKRACGILGK